MIAFRSDLGALQQMVVEAEENEVGHTDLLMILSALCVTITTLILVVVVNYQHRSRTSPEL